MLNLDAARKIPGYMYDVDLEWLAARASESLRIAEIGSWMGRSTRAMADNQLEGGILYAVDTWEGSDEEAHKKLLSGKPEDWLINQFRVNIGDALLSSPAFKVRAVQMTSHAAADYLGVGCYNIEFDMVFIDAAHDYENVKADILAWEPLVKAGGILCGHDHHHPPVFKAVSELVPDAEHVAGDIWAWRKPR